MKKLLCMILLAATLFSFSGCSKDRQIDKASLAETVTVTRSWGNTEYTFYILGEEEKSYTLTAESFEEACEIAKEESIPNLSLTKLQFMIYGENLPSKILSKDIAYISAEALLSPLVNVVLADNKSLEILSKSKDISNEVENLVSLSKTENKDIKSECFSIFNAVKAESNNKVNLPCIIFDSVLSADYKIFSMNIQYFEK